MPKKIEVEERYDFIDIDDIEFDIENPRILKELKLYPEEERQEKAAALLFMSNNDQPGPSRVDLKKSIYAGGGIFDAIHLVPLSDKKFKVVEGNTRLAIYRDLRNDEPENPKWQSIKSCIFYNKSPHEIDEMRLVAHLMGKKQWSLYAQGEFIDKLIGADRSFEKVAEILGGRTSEVRQKRQAFLDYQKFYMPHFTGNKQGHEKEEHMSFFREACNGGVERALEVEFGDKDKGKEEIAKWILDNKVTHSIHLRDIPKVFANNEIKEAFFRGEIKTLKEASSLINSPGTGGKTTLDDAEIQQLSDELTRRISKIGLKKIKLLKSDTMPELLDSLEILAYELETLLSEVQSNK